MQMQINLQFKIPNNLLRLNRNEYFTLNINGFYCYNSWFNCIDGFNNMFQIVLYNINDEITSIFDYKMQDGNPNVNDVRTNLNNLLLNHLLSLFFLGFALFFLAFTNDTSEHQI